MNKKSLETLLYSTIGVAVMAITLVAVNVIFSKVRTRVDLTQERRFTLSKGTKEILSKLDTPVKIRFYFTRGEYETPTWLALKAYAQVVEDLLAEYRQLSKGMIEIEKLDPQPDSDAEDSANLDGVEGQMLSLTEKVYLGLAVSCLDAKESLPALSPERERLLEYDLSRAIARVVKPEKPTIGIMTGLPMFGAPMNPMMMQMGQRQGQEPWVFVSELKRDFNVKQIELTAEKIDDDVKVLMVVHPRDISDAAQYAIDQFVLRGGKLIAMLDPMALADQRNAMMNPMQRAAAASGSNLDKLLKAWGIDYDPNKVLADMSYVTPLNRGGRVEQVPTVLRLNPNAINRDDVLTSQIGELLMAYPGAFSGTPATGLKQTVLVKSSTDSQLVEKMMAELSGEQVAKDFKPSGKEYNLAVRLSGKFKTAFPDGKPGAKKDEPSKKDDNADKADAKKDEKPADGGLKESSAENSVILIADADLVYDPVCVQISNFFGQRVVNLPNGNLPFGQAMVEQLAGDSSLIGVRSRATLNRPFTVVKQIQARAEDTYRNRIREFETSLSETRQKLGELQRGGKEKGQRFILSPEAQAEIAKLRKQEAEANRQLKDIRRNLREDVDALETRIKWLNLAGMPLLVSASGIALAVMKKKRTAAK